jgi:rRNA maturation endonuclease Nob1
MVLMNEKGECASSNMVRCMKCSYLIEDDGKWRCSECGRDIEKISDEDCSLNQQY